MYKIVSDKITKKWMLYSLGFFLIIITNIGCSSSYTTTNFRDNTNCNLSRLKGQTHKYFSSRIIVTSNFITDLQVVKVEGLPPGVILNKSRETIEGTPTKAGFYNIKVWYKDRYKGTHSNPTYNYIKHAEIAIYDELN